MKHTLNVKLLLVTIVILLAFTTVLLSCKKEASAQKANATIVYTGALAVDGCGWLVRLDSANNKPGNVYYSPTNLEKKYEVNNLRISINYKVLSTKFNCGDLPNGGQTQIEVLHIEPVYTTQ